MNMQEGMEGNPMAGTMKKFSRILAFLTVPFTMSFPKVCYICEICAYNWCCSFYVLFIATIAITIIIIEALYYQGFYEFLIMLLMRKQNMIMFVPVKNVNGPPITDHPKFPTRKSRHGPLFWKRKEQQYLRIRWLGRENAILREKPRWCRIK